MNSIKSLLLPAAVAALLAVPTTAAAQIPATRAADSALKYTTIEARAGESRFSIAYPTGSGALADTIRALELQLVGGSPYKGSLDDVAALRAHCAQWLATIDEGHNESATVEITLYGEGSGAVTLSANSYFYGGGAHGVENAAGLTLRKSDGARFGQELLNHFDRLRGRVARGLRAYFDVQTDDEMLQCLQLNGFETPESIDEIPAPETIPWVEGDSVVFRYTHYEIACYAAGEPTARLSLDEVWPWLPQEWRDALRDKADGGSTGRQDTEWAVGAQDMKKGATSAEQGAASAEQGAAEGADPASGPVFTTPEVMPSFPGNINQWLAQNVQYPVVAAENGVQGRVLVTFVIHSDGSVGEAKVTRSVDPSLDREALRVVKSMPRWNPGRQGGRAVNTQFTMPVSFRLQ